jgi:hypothetical protein
MLILTILFITEIWLWQAVWRLSRRRFRVRHSAVSVSIKTCHLQIQQLPLIIQWFRLLDVTPHHQAPQPQTITITIIITISITAPTATTQRHRTASCRRNGESRKCNGNWMPPQCRQHAAVWFVSCWLNPALSPPSRYKWTRRGFQASRQLFNEGRCGLLYAV